jgi:hypothetical protein
MNWINQKKKKKEHKKEILIRDGLNRKQTWSFNSTFKYIHDVLSINNDLFHSYVDSIYPSELEIKDTTK